MSKIEKVNLSTLCKRSKCKIPVPLRQQIIEHYFKKVRESVLRGYTFTLPNDAGTIAIIQKKAPKRLPAYSPAVYKMTGKAQRALVPHRQGREYNIVITGGWLEALDFHFKSGRTFNLLLFNILANSTKEYRHGNK